MTAIGKKIRLLRHQNGWTQKDVAERLEISVPAFSKIESGITDLNLSRLNQIAKLFDLTTLQLLTSSDADEVTDYAKEVNKMTKMLQQREEEIIILRKKVIYLYEKLYKV